MLRYWTNMAMLVAESQRAFWLPMMTLATGGPTGEDEAKLIVSKKAEAATRAAESLAMRSTPNTVVRGYRKKVHANSRRLSKSISKRAARVPNRVSKSSAKR